MFGRWGNLIGVLSRPLFDIQSQIIAVTMIGFPDYSRNFFFEAMDRSDDDIVRIRLTQLMNIGG